MVYLYRMLWVDGISRTGTIESICYTCPIEESHDHMCRLVAIGVYFQTLSIDGYWRLGKMLWEVTGANSLAFNF